MKPSLVIVFVSVCSVILYCFVAPSVSLPEYRLEIGDVGLLVELAAAPEERSRGLMFRRQLDQERGMLFVFDSPGEWGFWMKNTFIPLSIAFIDSEKKILNIEDMQPHDLRLVQPKGDVLYALEVNQGWFARHSITPGAVLVFSSNLESALGVKK